MLRKTIIALFTVASVAMLAPNVALARVAVAVAAAAVATAAVADMAAVAEVASTAAEVPSAAAEVASAAADSLVAASADPQSAAAVFAAEPLPPKVSAVAVSTEDITDSAADGDSIPMAMATTVTAIQAMPITIRTTTMAVAMSYGGACIPRPAGESAASGSVADPTTRRLTGVGRSNKVEGRFNGPGAFCTEAALLTPLDGTCSSAAGTCIRRRSP